jgi:hypothetical protein
VAIPHTHGVRACLVTTDPYSLLLSPTGSPSPTCPCSTSLCDLRQARPDQVVACTALGFPGLYKWTTLGSSSTLGVGVGGQTNNGAEIGLRPSCFSWRKFYLALIIDSRNHSKDNNKTGRLER